VKPTASARAGENAAAMYIAQALGDPSASRRPPEGLDAAVLVDAARRHRVLVLLGSLLRTADTLDAWPAEFVDALRSDEREAAMLDVLRHAELVAVLDALAADDLRVLPFKGAALAYTHYAAPYVRQRTDTDLLVASADMPALARCLAGLGYIHRTETSGHLVTYQSHYEKRDVHGVVHALDVHWRISDRQALAHRFAFEELWARRVPLSAVSPRAATVGDVHALLLALVHRAGHHPASRHLLWLFDVHLLANGLRPSEIRQFEELADARDLRQIVSEGLASARECFGPGGIDRILGAMRRNPGFPTTPPPIVRNPSQANVLRSDLAALPDWRTRGRLVREHLLPPASYMYARYGLESPLVLPVLYAWRALSGAPKWLRSGAAPAAD
jgi:hypothetical protein